MVFLALPVLPPTNLAVAVVALTGFKLTARGGANLTYGVYAATNVAPPPGNWVLIGNTVADGGGVIQFVDTPAAGRQRFYSVRPVAGVSRADVQQLDMFGGLTAARSLVYCGS